MEMNFLCWKIKVRYIGLWRFRPGLRLRVRRLIDDGKFIQAIKYIREQTGAQLWIAKEFADWVREKDCGGRPRLDFDV